MWSPGHGEFSNDGGRARGRGRGRGRGFLSPQYYPPPPLHQQQYHHAPGMPSPPPAPVPLPVPMTAPPPPQWQYYPSPPPFNVHGGEYQYPSFPPPPANPNEAYQGPSPSYTPAEYQGRNRAASYRQDNGGGYRQDNSAGYRQDNSAGYGWDNSASYHQNNSAGCCPGAPRQDYTGTYRPPCVPRQDTLYQDDSRYRPPGWPRQDDAGYQENGCQNARYRPPSGPRQDNTAYQENECRNARYRPLGGPRQDNTGYRPHNPTRYQDNNAGYHHPDAEYRLDSKKTTSTSLLERGGGGGGGSIKGLMESTPRTVRIDVTAWDKKIAVTLTNEASTVQEWVERQTGSLFGLDVEWKPNFMKGQNNKVALLQLCGDAGCLIVQMLFLDATPPALEDFLLDSTKSFGGVGIQTDNEKLLEDHGIQCRVPVELAALAAEKTGQASLSRAGLKMLLESILGLEMKKPKKISMSNWEKWTLDLKQIEYACIDAWASFAIFHKLLNWQ